MVNERTADGPPSLIDVLEACRVAQSYKVDADRWRRAHEIVEQERDQARRERDTWKDKWLDTYEALHDARAERDEAVARAEAAEARTAPAVAREEVAEAISRAWGEDGSVSPHGVLDRVWSLVSGADPAVFVVRESDVAAVEVRRASDGWYADGAWLASADETAEWVRDRAAEMVVCAARNEAVARASEAEAEQAADPVEVKAQELCREAFPDHDWGNAPWDTEDHWLPIENGFRRLAAHVLGQEAGR